MGDGVLSDCCECAQVHHEKLTDPKSEPTQTAHDEQETQRKKSIWKDVSLRWMPTRFSNPLWQNSTSVFGQLVRPSSLKYTGKWCMTLPLNNLQRGVTFLFRCSSSLMTHPLPAKKKRTFPL